MSQCAPPMARAVYFAFSLSHESMVDSVHSGQECVDFTHLMSHLAHSHGHHVPPFCRVKDSTQEDKRRSRISALRREVLSSFFGLFPLTIQSPCMWMWMCLYVCVCASLCPLLFNLTTGAKFCLLNFYLCHPLLVLFSSCSFSLFFAAKADTSQEERKEKEPLRVYTITIRPFGRIEMPLTVHSSFIKRGKNFSLNLRRRRRRRRKMGMRMKMGV